MSEGPVVLTLSAFQSLAPYKAAPASCRPDLSSAYSPEQKRAGQDSLLNGTRHVTRNVKKKILNTLADRNDFISFVNQIPCAGM